MRKLKPFGMLHMSRSFSQLLKLAASACDIFWFVPGVRGGTWVGRSNRKKKVQLKIYFFTLKWRKHEIDQFDRNSLILSLSSLNWFNYRLTSFDNRQNDKMLSKHKPKYQIGGLSVQRIANQTRPREKQMANDQLMNKSLATCFKNCFVHQMCAWLVD